MTASVYPSAFAELQDETFLWLVDDIRVAMMAPAFVPDFSQQFADSLNPTLIIDTSDPLTGRIVEDGKYRSEPAQFLQLLDPLAITSVVLYRDTGDPAYSPLIAYYDGDNLLGSPLIPRGLDEFVFPDAINGWLTFFDNEYSGEINTYELAGNETLSLGEVLGGDLSPASILLLSGRLTVTTQAVCATPDEPDDCSPPTIRSSLCE